ncbi:MAG: hypothetical protein CUN55_01225, partial [Phototrophicales bacterium]
MIQELMNRADQRGFVTLEDVLELLEGDGDDVAAIEALLDELDDLGIELRQDEDDPGIELDEDFDREALRDPDIGDINAVSPDDPVGLYFRQMAQEPLLTADDEISLAKRIEIGRMAFELEDNLNHLLGHIHRLNTLLNQIHLLHHHTEFRQEFITVCADILAIRRVFDEVRKIVE